MKTILLTGGAGFIGSHTCVSLLLKGYKLIVIDSLANSSKKSLKGIIKIVSKSIINSSENLIFEQGDIRDKKFLNMVFEKALAEKNKIEAVIHFAGLKAVEESVKFPLLYWDTNVFGSLKLFEVMEKFNCRNIVFSSSASIYKPVMGEKLFEDSFKEPITPYGKTKLTIEKILKDLYLSNKAKWKIVNLRYFNPAGSHFSGVIGEEPKNMPTNLFPILQKVISGKLKQLSIFGDDWPTKDGTCIRDFIHVMDLADAHSAALEFLQENKPQFISLNIGTGEGYSVLDVVQTFSKCNSVYLPYKIVGRRAGDSPFVVADNNLALKLLDWKPLKTLEDICIDSFRYLKNKKPFDY